MGLETDLIERTTVRFAEDLDSEKFKSMLVQMANDQNYRIFCNTEGIFNIGEYTQDELNDNHFLVRDYISIINGSISRRGKLFSTTSFSSKAVCYEEDETPKFKVLIFDTIPGYNIREHRQEEVKLWAEIKNYIESYKP